MWSQSVLLAPHGVAEAAGEAAEGGDITMEES